MISVSVVRSSRFPTTSNFSPNQPIKHVTQSNAIIWRDVCGDPMLLSLVRRIQQTKSRSRLSQISIGTCLAMPDFRNKHASSSFVSDVVKAKLTDQSNYCPVDVARDLQREHGVDIDYSTAFRAKEKALESINGYQECVYARLHKYYEDILRTNPRSTVSLERTSKNRFQRMNCRYGAIGLACISSSVCYGYLSNFNLDYGYLSKFVKYHGYLSNLPKFTTSRRQKPSKHSNT